MALLTTDDIRSWLREPCEAAGTQKVRARQHWVALAYLGDILHGRRDPDPRTLVPLALGQVQRLYVSVDQVWHPEDIYDDTRLCAEEI